MFGAFLGRVAFEELPGGGADSVLGSGLGFSEHLLGLGEDLLDRVQVGRVFGQQQEPGADRPQRTADFRVFVARQVVGHDHVAW